MSNEESSTRNSYKQSAEFYRRRYEKNVEKISVQTAIRYYKRKKDKGEEWIPKPRSKLCIWCRENGFDAKALIEGTQQLSVDS